jgi:hypothetical protein
VTDLEAILEELEASAAECGDATRTSEAGAVSWSRAGQRFAVLRGGEVDLRVGAGIGAAAIRTPDTSASAAGPDWVAFAPRELDEHARDRLTAWFAAAHRRAAG